MRCFYFKLILLVAFRLFILSKKTFQYLRILRRHYTGPVPSIRRLAELVIFYRNKALAVLRPLEGGIGRG